MDTLKAFAMGELSRGKPLMVFDWEKAARLIVERKAQTASAGLQGDWEWTGGLILEDGRPVPKGETYTYLASTWAVPELGIDGEVIRCYRMEDEDGFPGWDAHTYWPFQALAILGPTPRKKK